MEIKNIKDDQGKFIYYSIRERLAIGQMKQFIEGVKVCNYSEIDSYDSWDALYKIEKQYSLCEVKVRKHYSTDFNNWIFEKNKFNGLQSVILNVGDAYSVKPEFIVFLKDCVAIWDVTNLTDSDFDWEELRGTSVDGNLTKKSKLVARLLLKDATIHSYQIDMNKLSEEAKSVFKFIYPNHEYLISTFDTYNTNA